MMTVWAQVSADNPIAARMLLVALYGASNIVGLPTLCR
jgi:hypothetical protein